MGVDWNTVILSGLSALFGSGIAIFAADRANKLEKERLNEIENQTIFGFLQALHDEIETLWETYQNTVGKHVELLNPDNPLLVYWPVYCDYFTVYNNNSLYISKIKDNELRKEIVTTYSLAKGLIDSFKMNNELVYKYEQSSKLYAETNNQLHLEMQRINLISLCEYGNSIKKSHDILKTKVSNLLRSLIKIGVLSNQK